MGISHESGSLAVAVVDIREDALEGLKDFAGFVGAAMRILKMSRAVQNIQRVVYFPQYTLHLALMASYASSMRP